MKNYVQLLRIEQWLKNYSFINENYLKTKNIFYVNYEKLCEDNRHWEDLCKFVGINTLKKDPEIIFENINDKEIKEFDKVLFNECMKIYDDFSLKI